MADGLAGLIRVKYPRAYDDLDDATLEAAVLEKFPQYKDLVRPGPQLEAAQPADWRDSPLARGLEAAASVGSFASLIPHPVAKAVGYASQLALAPFGAVRVAKGITARDPWQVAAGVLEAAPAASRGIARLMRPGTGGPITDPRRLLPPGPLVRRNRPGTPPTPTTEGALVGALQETRRPDLPALISKTPERYGPSPSPPQPRWSVSGVSPKPKFQQAAEDPATLPTIPGVRVARPDELIQNIKTELARIAPAVAGRPIPKARVTAGEVRQVLTGREALRQKAAGAIPKGMEGPLDRLRLEYLRTQATAQQLRTTGGREAQRFEQAARELGSRLSNMERTAIRLAKAGRGQRGAIDVEAAISLGAGIAGATAGWAISEDQPVPTRIGTALAFGLVGTRGAPAFANWLRSHPDLAMKFFDRLNAIRSELYLTGYAIPKNVVGGIGSTIQAAGETGRLAPLRELARPAKAAQAFARGVLRPIDIGIAGKPRPSGPMGRTISGIDSVFLESLKRAHVPTDMMERLMLRRPVTDFVSLGTAKALTSTPGRTAVVFQRTPFNVGFGGIEELAALGRPATRLTGEAAKALRRRRAVTYGAGAAGVAAGAATEDFPAWQRAALLPLAVAGAGVRAPMFAAGAALAGGSEALRGLSPLPEYGFDPRQVFDPREWLAALRVWRQLEGRR